MDKDITLSYSEKEKFHKAFRQHEFRILFDEYFDEISDEKYRKEKEDYLLNLYFNGELKDDQILIKPNKAFCIKTKIIYNNQTHQKLFINICSHNGLEEICFQNISNGMINIPYSLSQIRPDKYGNNNSCLTIDCCVNPNTIDIIRTYNDLLSCLLENVCINIENNIMKDKEKIHRDYKILKNMSCKGNTPFLLCINKKCLKKKVLIEEEKKLEILKKEYENNESKSCNKKELNELLNKSKIETDIKKNEEYEKVNLNLNEIKNENEINNEIDTKINDKDKRILIYHQGILDISSFFKNTKNDISLNLPNKIKVLVNLNNIISKDDINITIEKNILKLQFNNEEKDEIITLPYPCNNKNYSCILKKMAKKLEIYLNLCEDYVNEKLKELNKNIQENINEHDSLKYIDDVIKHYEVKENEKRKIDKENNLHLEEMNHEIINLKKDEDVNNIKNIKTNFLESYLVIKNDNSNIMNFNIQQNKNDHSNENNKSNENIKFDENNKSNEIDKSNENNKSNEIDKSKENYKSNENDKCNGNNGKFIQNETIKNITKQEIKKEENIYMKEIDTINKNILSEHKNELYKEKEFNFNNDNIKKKKKQFNIYTKELINKSNISLYKNQNININNKYEHLKKIKNNIDINESIFLNDINYQNIDEAFFFPNIIWATYI